MQETHVEQLEYLQSREMKVHGIGCVVRRGGKEDNTEAEEKMLGRDEEDNLLAIAVTSAYERRETGWLTLLRRQPQSMVYPN